MSFLFWLFGLGALAIAFPFVFHLIRRQPQGQMEFSSLIFLRPTPPRISRRSRIDNWLLLLLRCLVVLLIALAFMRPFLPNNANLVQNNAVPRRVAILLDSSASMRKQDVWEAARKQVLEVVDSFEDEDQLALFHFDRQTQPIVDFPANRDASEEERRVAIRESLKDLTPSWDEGRPGLALMDMVNQLIQTNEANSDSQGLSQLQVVLVSDMQSAPDLQRLQSFRWPDSVNLELAPVTVPDRRTTDASLFLVNAREGENEAQPRLRVQNASGGQTAGFEVTWHSAEASDDSEFADRQSPPQMPIMVPPGATQTFELPEGFHRGLGRFQLTGDTELLGNEFFAATASQSTQTVIALSDAEPQSPADSLFYFQMALPQSSQKLTEMEVYPQQDTTWIEALQGQAGVSRTTDAESARDYCAVLVDRPVESDELQALLSYWEAGGRVLLKLDDPDVAASVAALSGAQHTGTWKSNEERDYLLLGSLQFTHPLLQPFREPGFNNFTKIHFWEIGEISFPEPAAVQVIARFDNGLPAVWEHQHTNRNGTVIGLAFDWQPDLSQLALSSKFVPLVNQLVAGGRTGNATPTHYWLGLPVPLPSTSPADEWTIQSLTSPGQPVTVSTATAGAPGNRETDPAETQDTNNTTRFQAREPGIYQATDADGTQYFYALNVHPNEWEDDRVLEQHFAGFGIPLGRHLSTTQQREQERLKKDLELEQDQKLWKYLILAALVLLVAEMSLAGRTSSKLQAGRDAASMTNTGSESTT